MLAYSFDDGLKSQLQGARLLEDEGINGTFYVPAGLLDTTDIHMSRNDIASLAAVGHEIGSHTLTHINLHSLGTSDPYDFFKQETDDEQLTSQIVGSKRLLETITEAPVTGIAPPYGRMNGSNLIKATYEYARSTKKQMITDQDDPYNIGSFGIKDSTSDSDIEALLAMAKPNDGLVVINFHDIAFDSPEPRHAMNPIRFAQIASQARESGMQTVTVRRGLQILGLI